MKQLSQSFNFPFHCCNRRMLFRCDDLQVFYTVIRFLFIQMMHLLPGFQASAQAHCHHKAMFENTSRTVLFKIRCHLNHRMVSTDNDNLITLRRNPIAFLKIWIILSSYSLAVFLVGTLPTNCFSHNPFSIYRPNLPFSPVSARANNINQKSCAAETARRCLDGSPINYGSVGQFLAPAGSIILKTALALQKRSTLLTASREVATSYLIKQRPGIDDSFGSAVRAADGDDTPLAAATLDSYRSIPKNRAAIHDLNAARCLDRGCTETIATRIRHVIVIVGAAFCRAEFCPRSYLLSLVAAVHTSNHSRRILRMFR